MNLTEEQRTARHDLEECLIGFSPMTREAIDAQQQARQLYKRSEELALAIYTHLTGVELPLVYPFTDADGNCWVIHLDARLILARRGGNDATTD